VGADAGAAVPRPAALVHPFIVCVTLYDPALLTVIEELVAPVLQSKLPVAVVDKVDVPLQLFTTDTTGVAGTTGAALIEATVAVEVHGPELVTVTL
jgi:hypothetical protein